MGGSAAALMLAVTPAVAAPFGSDAVVGNAPLAIALGAAGFAAVALLAFRKAVHDGKAERQRAAAHIADLRAQLDEYEVLLSSAREITVLWAGQGGQPRIFGQTTTLLPRGRRPEAILDFSLWLGPSDAERVAQALAGLRVRGESFAVDARDHEGNHIRLSGAVLGGGTALRIRARAERPDHTPSSLPDPQVSAVLGALSLPAFLRRADGRLAYVNPAYEALLRALGRRSEPGAPAELLDRRPKASTALTEPRTLSVSLPAGQFDLVEFPLDDGTAGYLRPRPAAAEPLAPPLAEGRTAALVDALAIPVAIFDANRQLIAFNRAYAELWKAGAWLKLGADERAILDRLRREDQLPAERDYQAWRNQHLSAYGLKTARTDETWHLPDGRTLNVTAAPAGSAGGVIYLFEDISSRLALMSQNRALASVQRSTLNALSDAVAVFGTNGRLQLFNPRLSALWQLPLDFLERNPHIDQIADAAAAVLPEDGAAIWRDVKRAVIDLTPTRADTAGRLNRSDGKLIDYAVVRLPDGQKLVTFLDVTDSANYSRVLKERNDALVTADRLKDAFVQNVSYELRSPLTNIIGFADLLAAPEMGPLNER